MIKAPSNLVVGGTQFQKVSARLVFGFASGETESVCLDGRVAQCDDVPP